MSSEISLHILFLIFVSVFTLFGSSSNCSFYSFVLVLASVLVLIYHCALCFVDVHVYPNVQTLLVIVDPLLTN